MGPRHHEDLNPGKGGDSHELQGRYKRHFTYQYVNCIYIDISIYREIDTTISMIFYNQLRHLIINRDHLKISTTAVRTL